MIKLNKKDVATFGYPQYEEQGTIAIDFATDFDKINNIPGCNIRDDYRIIGLGLNKDIFEDNKNICIRVIIENKTSKLQSYVNRSIEKKKLLDLMIRVKIQLSNSISFENNTIRWHDLTNEEEK